MSFNQPITIDDNWFTGEDKILDCIVYPTGTTLAQAMDPLTLPQDITDWVIVWVLRKFRDSGDIALERTAFLQDPTNGLARVTIDHASTTDIDPGDYFMSWARQESGFQTILSFGEAVLQHAAVR